MSESSSGYSEKTEKITMEITKQDIFFLVSIEIDGKDFFDMITEGATTNEEKGISKSFLKYQLSPDKQTLIPISGMLGYVMTFHDDNKTIENGFGWFKKK